MYLVKTLANQNKNVLEIKPGGFESTIRDMKAERYKDK